MAVKTFYPVDALRIFEVRRHLFKRNHVFLNTCHCSHSQSDFNDYSHSRPQKYLCEKWKFIMCASETEHSIIWRQTVVDYWNTKTATNFDTRSERTHVDTNFFHCFCDSCSLLKRVPHITIHPVYQNWFLTSYWRSTACSEWIFLFMYEADKTVFYFLIGSLVAT